MKTHIYLNMVLIAFALLNCASQPKPPREFPIRDEQPTPTQVNPELLVDDPNETTFPNYSNDQPDKDSVVYKDYKLVKKTKMWKDKYTPHPSEISYAELQKNGKRIAVFDSIRHGLDVPIYFDLFELLKGDTKQFVISQTAPRSGSHWVVSVDPTLKVIFDSDDWWVGGEEIRWKDIDGDGNHEILMGKAYYYEFGGAMSEAPHVQVIFSYDKPARKYLPAKTSFSELIGDIPEMKKMLSDPTRDYKSRLADIVLTYTFAGKEKDGWEFFEEEYQKPDKQKVRLEIKAAFKDDPVYKFIYRRGKR